VCLCRALLQDIGESEASELVALFRPLAEKAVQELLGDVDLSSQGSLEGLDLRDLVRRGGGMTRMDRAPCRLAVLFAGL
jgi:hypothetical protein